MIHSQEELAAYPTLGTDLSCKQRLFFHYIKRTLYHMNSACVVIFIGFILQAVCVSVRLCVPLLSAVPMLTPPPGVCAAVREHGSEASPGHAYPGPRAAAGPADVRLPRHPESAGVHLLRPAGNCKLEPFLCCACPQCSLAVWSGPASGLL